jgi:predicted RNA-binding protein YlqC (UPF0109 family)
MSVIAEQLDGLVRLLVSQPDAVAVAEQEGADETRFELRVADEDVGKVIGRRGQTIRALRLLLDLRGEVEDRDFELELIEDGAPVARATD